MRIAGIYSFNNGEREVIRQHGKLLDEVKTIIGAVNASDHKSKESKETTKLGKFLFSPGSINTAFKEKFMEKGWAKKKIKVEYSLEFYLKEYEKRVRFKASHREIDFIKEHLGLEIQFGKYSFASYDVCMKMPIFKNNGLIDCGIEMLPMKALTNEMSTGVPYFEQLTWDLKNRGVSDIDIPVMIIGIDA